MHLGGEEGGRWSGQLAQHVSRFGIKMLPYPSFLPSASFLLFVCEPYVLPYRRGLPASDRREAQICL